MPNPVLALDSADAAPAVLAAAAPLLAAPVRGYLVTLGGQYAATAAQVQALRWQGLALGALYEAWPQADLESTDAAPIAAAAKSAAAEATALGFPAGSRIIGCAEAGTAVTSAAIAAWAEGITAAGFLPGFYDQPASVPFQGALAAARASSAVVAAMPLWVASYVTLERNAAGLLVPPPWAPPTCAGATVIGHQFGGDLPAGALAYDASLIDLDAEGWWQPMAGATGFSDVPPDAWYAPAVEEAVAEGLMQGVGGGLFQPLSAPNRAQLASVAVNILAAARKPVGAPADAAPARPRRGKGARPSRIRAGVVHYLDLLEHRILHRPGAAPVGYSLIPGIPGMGAIDQQQTSMCTCASSDWALRWFQRQSGGAAVDLSWPALYGYVERTFNVDAEGLTPDQVLSTLVNWGMPPYTLDPLAEPNETWQEAVASLTDALTAAAAPYRISGYAAVPVTLADLHSALSAGVPVLLDGTVFPAFEDLHAMPLSEPPADLVAALGGDGTSILGVLPASWTGQAAAGGHQWLALGILPRMPYLPEPISEGDDYYVICATTWGAWASGPQALFLVPSSYVTANCYEAWTIAGLEWLAPSPTCRALALQVQQLAGFLAAYGATIPPSHLQAVQAALASAQAQQAAQGCPV